MTDKEVSYCVLFLAYVAFASVRPGLYQVILALPLHEQAQRLAILLDPEQV